MMITRTVMLGFLSVVSTRKLRFNESLVCPPITARPPAFCEAPFDASRYHLLGPLGGGAVLDVALARDLRENTTVVLKQSKVPGFESRCFVGHNHLRNEVPR